MSLFTAHGETIARASIKDMSEGGFLVAYVPPQVEATISVGQRMGFSFVVPTGEVRGSAEVVRVDARQGEVAFRLVNIDNEGGLPNLLHFLHSYFCGVD